MSTIDYVIRDDAGALERGTLSTPNSTSISVAAGEDVSLNLMRGDIVSYARVGNDLQVTLTDGSVIVLSGYFGADGGPIADLFLSANGALTQAVFVPGAEGPVSAGYNNSDNFGKYSPDDALYFVRGSELGAPGPATVPAQVGGGGLPLIAGAGLALAGLGLLAGGDESGGSVLGESGTADDDVVVGDGGDEELDDDDVAGDGTGTEPDGDTSSTDGGGGDDGTGGETDSGTDGETDGGTGSETDGGTDGGTGGETDGGTGGETDGGTGGETDGGTGGETDGGTGGETDGGTDGETDGGTGGETDGGTDGGTGGGTDDDTEVDRFSFRDEPITDDNIITLEEFDDRIKIRGHVESGSTVEVEINGVVSEAGVAASGSGAWWAFFYEDALVAATAGKEGLYEAEIIARATDAAGNTATITRTVTFDLTEPSGAKEIVTSSDSGPALALAEADPIALDFDNIVASDTGPEMLDMTSVDGAEVTLTLDDLIDAPANADDLVLISGDADDVVLVDALVGVETSGQQVIDGVAHDIYDLGGGLVLAVDEDVQVNPVI